MNPIRILVVDDDIENEPLLVDRLEAFLRGVADDAERKWQSPIYARTWEEEDGARRSGVNWFESDCFDLVVLDLELGREQGSRALSQIRRGEFHMGANPARTSRNVFVLVLSKLTGEAAPQVTALIDPWSDLLSKEALRSSDYRDLLKRLICKLSNAIRGFGFELHIRVAENHIQYGFDVTGADPQTVTLNRAGANTPGGRLLRELIEQGYPEDHHAAHPNTWECCPSKYDKPTSQVGTAAQNRINQHFRRRTGQEKNVLAVEGPRGESGRPGYSRLWVDRIVFHNADGTVHVLSREEDMFLRPKALCVFDR